MDNQTTDRTILTANQDIPNIVDRHTATLTTSELENNGFGQSMAKGTDSYTTNLKSLGNNDWDIYMVDNQKNVTFNVPGVWSDEAGNNDITEAHTYIDDDGGYLRINTLVQKLFGSITDTYTLYYVIYSTRITDEIIL